MLEVRKPQDLRTGPSWSITSGKIESKPEDFPGFRCLRAVASLSGVKWSEMLSLSGVGTFRQLLVDEPSVSRLPVFCSSRVPRRRSLLIRGTDERSVQSCQMFIDAAPRLAAGVREFDGIDSFFPSLLPLLVEDEGQKGFALFVPAWHIVLATATWDTLFSRKWQDLAQLLACLLNVCFVWRGNLSTDSPVTRQKRFQSPLKAPTLHWITVGRNFEPRWRCERRSVLWPRKPY